MFLDRFLVSKKEENSKKSTEKPLRSIVKAITWRILGTLDTVVITWFITDKLSVAFTVGSIELITKMVLYFFHERIWNAIKWGKK